MASEKYQGWANPETWVVNLWLTNDEDTYYSAQLTKNRDELERLVRDIVDLRMCDEASLASDLAGWALQRVDWNEVFDALHEK